MFKTIQHRLHKLFLLALAIVVMQASPMAKASDTSSMLITCQSESLEFSSVCLGFMAGIDETHNSMRSLLITSSDNRSGISIPKDWPGYYCPPMELTPEQLRDVFISYALSNPESQQRPAATTTLIALANTLPCSN